MLVKIFFHEVNDGKSQEEEEKYGLLKVFRCVIGLGE
jgi:hypothetical protein